MHLYRKDGDRWTCEIITGSQIAPTTIGLLALLKGENSTIAEDHGEEPLGLKTYEVYADAMVIDTVFALRQGAWGHVYFVISPAVQPTDELEVLIKNLVDGPEVEKKPEKKPKSSLNSIPTLDTLLSG